MGKNLIQQARGKGGPTYRAPSFKYKAKVSYPGTVKEGKIIDFVKCRGHSSPLAKMSYDNGEESYIIAPEGKRVGDVIQGGEGAQVVHGNILCLKDVPVGTSIFNIESKPGDGGKFVRSGGCFAKVIAKKDNEITVMLPSKKQKTFNPQCRATIGIIAGSGRKEKPFLKAGNKYHYMKSRNKLYPRVCGISMNAVDHPHGTSRSSKKGHPTIAPRNAPPGRKVGKLRPRRTGKKR
ncbi:50S ribosomal protein L2 [Candidatus Woesearchaeota archaeon]|nr:50S ribosomal protein L2 [Candidatus Woesearchaeota archaeon]